MTLRRPAPESRRPGFRTCLQPGQNDTGVVDFSNPGRLVLQVTNRMPITFDYDSIPVGYYDAVYARHKGIQSKWHHLKFARFHREMIGVRRHLDIGCGPGTFIGSFDAVQVSVGVDIAEPQIVYAKERYGGHGREFQQVDSGPLPFDGSSFDLVTIIELIEHLPPRENDALIRESMRVLAPGGMLLVSTPNYGGFWPALEAMIGRFGGLSYAEQHITHYDRKSLRRLLEGAGGTNVAVRAYMGIAPFVAAVGWRVADFVSRLESDRLVNPYGLLLFARARRAR